MPRRAERPHPWRSALLIFGVFLLLAIVTGLLIRFAFTSYQLVDDIPALNSGEAP